MSASTPKTDLADFVAELATLPDNQRYGSLKGRTVADLGVRDARLHDIVIRAGADRCYVADPTRDVAPDERVVVLPVRPLDAGVPSVDVALFDSRRCPDFDHVAGVSLLVAQMRRILNADGYAFAVLKTGFVMGGFDVHNPIVRTGTEVLPSEDYLFRDLLADCTVRTLAWLPAPSRYEAVRLFRLSLKRPTFLLILGRSHAGKTSLARDLQSLDEHMHVSNDYIYSELVTRSRDGQATEFPQQLVSIAGDGSGKACGAFNRALETSAEMLTAYLQWLMPLLPRNRRVVSMDFDLVDPQQVALAKQLLADAGFSVWVVTR